MSEVNEMGEKYRKSRASKRVTEATSSMKRTFWLLKPISQKYVGLRGEGVAGGNEWLGEARKGSGWGNAAFVLVFSPLTRTMKLVEIGTSIFRFGSKKRELERGGRRQVDFGNLTDQCRALSVPNLLRNAYCARS